MGLIARAVVYFESTKYKIKCVVSGCVCMYAWEYCRQTNTALTIELLSASSHPRLFGGERLLSLFL